MEIKEEGSVLLPGSNEDNTEIKDISDSSEVRDKDSNKDNKNKVEEEIRKVDGKWV